MAIKNLSSSATEIKKMTELSKNDNWCIDKCLKYCIYDGSFKVQDELLLDKYFSYFEQFLITINLDEKYYYCPQLFAYDYYGDAELDFLVLYFAKMTSVFDFNKPKITVLDINYINDINKLFTAYKTEVTRNKENPPTYK